ncbi:MAG: hypothetical protein IR159_04270 [Brevundimonas sp.]|nr:hypothetical protein [Brevundimonas sp.]
MAIEADVLARKQEEAALASERRAPVERRGRDRRKPGSRINQKAPMQSTMRGVGLSALGLVATVMVITIIYSEVAGVALPYVTLAFEAAALAVAVIVVALGFIEQRLTEIRLELMMLNGGRRQGEERRQGSRHSDPPVA